VDAAAATEPSTTTISFLPELLRRRLGGGSASSSSGELPMACDRALPFLGVSTMAPFLAVADAAAHCLLLEVFPLVSRFVGLRFLPLEGGDFCFDF